MQPLTPNNRTAPPRFRIDDLEVDIGKAEVRRGDERIALPKLSFDLLYALIDAAPSIVTNEELLQRVWPGLLVSPESVSQRVKLLRTSIGDDSQQPRYILGVRGRGYRLIPVVERCDWNPTTSDATNPPVSTTSAAIPGEPTSQTRAPKRSKRRRALLIGGIVAAGGLVGLTMRAIVVRTHELPSLGADLPAAAAPSGPGAIPIPISKYSIAVLPFVDMSQKKDQEYFADGMAEEIIDLLVKIPELKVISRASSFQFKGKTEDLRSIGTQLGVAYVLEGSVRKSADRLRVTAQLIDSRDGAQLFSQTYDQDLSDVLKMQDEIAFALVQALQLEVEANIVSRPVLRNTKAYTLYLQGLHASSRFDQQGLEQAVSDFERVIEIDPTFAPAHLLLGNAYLLLGLYGFMPPAIAFERDRLANERALILDPNLALAHAQLGDIHRAYDWDWAAADRELKQALSLAPADADILFLAAVQSLGMGRWDEALKQVNAALALDPLNPSRYQVLTLIQWSRGRLEEAEAAARRALELIPMGPFGHFYLGNVLLARSQPDAALTEFSKETVDSARLAGLATSQFAFGRKADSDATLAQMISHPTDHPFFMARVYAFRGEPNEALKWLDRAFSQKDSGMLPLILGDPVFRKIGGDPGYKAFLKKMNLPE